MIGRSTLTQTRGLWWALAVSLIALIAMGIWAYLLDLTLIDLCWVPDKVRTTIAAMSAEQRLAHVWITGTFDVVFPLAYGVLFAGAALRFCPRASGYIALPALLAVPVDWAEGIVQVLALTGGADWLASKALITPLKFTLFVTAFAIALSGAARRPSLKKI